MKNRVVALILALCLTSALLACSMFVSMKSLNWLFQVNQRTLVIFSTLCVSMLCILFFLKRKYKP